MQPMLAFFVGHWEFLIVILVVLLLFAPKIPQAMRSMGRSVVEFKKGISEAEEVQQSSPSDEEDAKG